MEFTRIKSVILALSTATSIGLVGAPAYAATTWDLTSASPDGNVFVVGAREFARRVAEATNGEVVITVHSGGALGIQGPESMTAVKDGVVPMAEFSFDQQTSTTPLALVTGAPGMAMGYDENKKLRDALMPILDAKSAEFNQKILYMAPWPGQGFYAKRPLDQLADLSGLKIRAGSGSAFDFLSLLGASPALLPWGEVAPALATGAIEGVATSSQSGVDGRFWEFLDRYYALDYSNPLSTVSVNLDAWNALTPELQAAIEKVAAEVEPEIWANSQKIDDDSRAKLKENGVEVIIPTAEFKQQTLDASAKQRAEAVAKAGEDGAKLAASVGK